MRGTSQAQEHLRRVQEVDRTFNAAHFMQSLDRIHRVGLGKHEKVHYYILKSERSIDDVIDDRLNEKVKRLFELLNDDFTVLDLDSMEEEFSELTEEEADFAALIKSLRRRVRER